MSNNEGKKVILRDSDNPIIEEYKEDLSSKPRSIARDEERITRMECFANELLNRIESLEQRIKALEDR